MSRKLFLFIVLVISLLSGAAWGVVPIEVENYSFEIPEDGIKRDIAVGTPGVVTGWARTDPTSSAGREYGWQPTDANATGFMGKDAVIFNLTEFLIQDGDEFQMTFDTKVTWAANTMRAQLYYDDEGNRVAVATTDVNLVDFVGWPSQSGVNWGTYTVDFNASDVPASVDHKLGIQFHHIRTIGDDSGGDNIWAGLDYIRLVLTSPLMRVQEPYPEHESTYIGDNVILTWIAGPNLPQSPVPSYRVYFSDSWTDVSNGAPAADKGSTSTTSYLISSLIKGLTYYWRIDTVSGSNTYRGNIWNFTTKPLLAYRPDPCDSEDFASVEPLLSWEAGSGAVEGHVVFFGDNFNNVNNAPVGTSGPAPFRAFLDVADTNWAPSEAGLAPLDVSTTYYWRIDEVESSSPQIINKGTVWNFTTVPVPGLGSILCELYEGISGGAVADLTGNIIYPDNPTYTEHLTTFEAPHRSIVEYGSRVHGWLYVRKPGEYTFWIASGENSQLWLSTDEESANVSMIASVDFLEERDGWTNPREFDKYPEIQQSGPIYLEAESLYYIMALHKKGWGYDNLSVAWSGPDSGNQQEIIPGTSLIPFKRISSFNPNPRSGAMEVRRDPTLKWAPGPHAAIFDVYFGTDFDIVSDANRTNDPYGVLKNVGQEPNYYTPGILDFETTYYWRIDDFNDPNIFKGGVWNFTVGNYLLVDDFEDYNDYPPDRIFDTWKDYATNNSGATVGYLDDPYAETTIVHEGEQSMPLFFDHDGTVNEGTPYQQTGTDYYSQTDRTWDAPQDWTAEGVAALVVWFRGYLGVIGGVSYDTGTSTYTMTGAGSDIWDVIDPRETTFHDEFHFAYKQLSGEGEIIARVESVENIHEWAKAGVMIRDTLDKDSRHAMVVVTPEQGLAFQYRTEVGGASTTGAQITDVNAPHWVRIRRQQNTFTSYHSEDGQTWLEVGEAEESFVDIEMNATTYIGLALTSHTANVTCDANFTNVSTAGTISPTGPFTTSQDIGIFSNDTESLYVILKDNDGDSHLVEHSEPNATQIYEWQEWPIDLQEFGSEGVNLEAITQMSIGIGDPEATSPSGKGKVYIDDIRLYRPGCFPSKLKPLADFSNNCVVDAADIEIMAGEWLSTTTEEVELMADLDSDDDVDFADYAKLASAWLEEEIWPQL